MIVVSMYSDLVIYQNSIWALCYFSHSIYTLAISSSILYLIPNLLIHGDPNSNNSTKITQFVSLEGLNLLKLCFTPVLLILLIHTNWVGPTIIAWFGHIIFSDYQFKITFIVFFFYTSYLTSVLPSLHFSSSAPYDYILSTLNFFIWLWISFFSNNIFTFIFFLELLSASIMLMLITSSFSSTHFYNNLSYNSYSYFHTSTPLAFLQTLLFFFWISLLSSLMLFVFIIFFYVKIVTFDWSITDLVLNFLINISSLKLLTTISLIWLLLIICMLIKCGTVPFYFWKPTFFKGMSFTSLFFYVYVYYFSIFFYLTYVIFMYLNEFFIANIHVMTLILLIAIVTLPSLLFESYYTKTFLALSSILNSIFIFFIMCSIPTSSLIFLL